MILRQFAVIALLSAPILRPAAVEDLEAMFEAVPLDGTDLHVSEVWGQLNLQNESWVKTVPLGWIYIESRGDASGFYFWSDPLGWAFTASGFFPNVYLFDPGRWALLDFSDLTGVKFFALDDRSWHMVQRPNQSAFSDAFTVPEEWQGFFKAYSISGSSYHTRTISI